MRVLHTKGVLTGLALTGLMAYACIALLNIQNKVTDASKTVQSLQAQLEQLQEDNAALQYAIDNQDDPEVIEDIARSELGLVMPDEWIFYDGGD